MNIIIQQFLKKVISLKEKGLEELNNINFLSDFTDNLNAELMKMGREIIVEYINELEEVIYSSPERKENYKSYQKESLANQRKLITIFGEIEFSRRYYQNKENKEDKIYLLDRAIGLSKNERMLVNVEENMLELASIKSYEYAGQKAAYDTVISKETVKNKISELNFSNIDKKKFEIKHSVLNLYIQADEDHVALQSGGISMPRLITLFENNKEGKLEGKKKFGGTYISKIDELWEEVLRYIESRYDYEKIDKIFIMGDGASWIKTGLEWLPKSKYIADRFHINKAIITMTGNNREYIEKIRSAIFELDFKRVKELEYEILAEEMDTKRRKRQNQMLEYILNNEEGIKNSIIYDVPGCAAEGDISHTYSDRLSSRPMGWSQTNVDKMARLRVLAANGENIRLVTRNIKNIAESIIKEQETVKKMMNKDRYKRDDGVIYNIPELKYGEYDLRDKIKEIIKYQAI